MLVTSRDRVTAGVQRKALRLGRKFSSGIRAFRESDRCPSCRGVRAIHKFSAADTRAALIKG